MTGAREGDKSGFALFKKKHPTVGPKHMTGKRAELAFERWLPDGWLARRQDPDFFLDYYVEIVENGEPTGRQLAAQIKGTQTKKNADGKTRIAPKYRAKIKHIRYWLRDCQHPVFLFLIDVDKETGHWLFAQKYADEHIAKAALEKSGRITLHFSKDDSLEDKPRFFAALGAAEKYVRNLHPGTVQAALAKKRQELERKEPRLNYSIFATEGKNTIHLSPKEPFPIKMEILSEHATEIMKEFSQALAEGSELKLPFGKIKLKGSPLFDEFNNSGGELILKFGDEAPGQLVLSHPALSRSKSFTMDGNYRLGSKVVTFASSLADAPIGIKCALGIEDNSMDLRFKNLLTRWQGVPVLHLPYFEQVFELFDAMENGKGVHFLFLMRGVTVVEVSCSELATPETKILFNFIYWVARCRTVAKLYNINPKLPEFGNITEEHFQLVDDLLALQAGHKRMIPTPNVSVNCTVPTTPETELRQPTFGALMLDRPKGDLHLLGTPLLIGPYRLVFTNVNMVPASVSQDGMQTLEITGTDSTQRLIERY
jgi:hypothetical protein